MNLLLEEPAQNVVIPKITADELLALPNDKDFELVNGNLTRCDMGWEAEFYGSNLQGLLWSFCREHAAGYVNGSSASYQCFDGIFPEDPHRIRKPDVSFIAAGRLTNDGIPKGHCTVVPDLCVEVVSPHDLYHEVEEKVDEYLRAGVRLVWVVDPHAKSIRVHRANRTVQDLEIEDQLSGDDVIVGFACPVRDVFRLPGVRGFASHLDCVRPVAALARRGATFF